MTAVAFKVNACTCPACGKVVDAVTAHPSEVDQDAIPTAGDFTICLYCRTLLVFEFTLRTATKEEALEMGFGQGNLI
jgi:hypothetical protein